MNGDFEPSRLGTKTHWDQVYENELQKYKDIGDVGEVWFGYDSVERVLDWIEEKEEVPKDAPILDLGCGNGITLVELYERGYQRLTGLDYSEQAIELAKNIAKDKQQDITYRTTDILDGDRLKKDISEQYRIVLDKGTYDAISLNPEGPELNRKKYVENVGLLLQPDGLLILTSCNWTEEELQSQFTEDKGFKFYAKIKTPSFQFGGATGSREACVIFQKM